MYPIGTKLKIIDAGNGAHGCDGCLGTVTDKTGNICLYGMLKEDEGFNVKITKSNNGNALPNEIWRVNNDGKYEVIGKGENTMTKSDLKTGMTVKLRNGDLYKVLKDVDTLLYGHQDIFFANKEIGFIHGNFFDDNLICIGSAPCIDGHTLDIIEIYDYINNGNILKFDTNNILWKRPETKKMTVSEVEKILGYKVEIISE